MYIEDVRFMVLVVVRLQVGLFVVRCVYCVQ